MRWQTLLFKRQILYLYKIKRRKAATDQATGTVTIEGSVYSMDSPAVRAKVMGTLRSAFFQDTVKMKMSGFIGTVSATHKTIIYLQCLMVKE
jgi:glyceraldehyde-3-phosphate dehydrogenase/erythrose-4-phosphate dehydrogenase